jgi:hypothetical protein
LLVRRIVLSLVACSLSAAAVPALAQAERFTGYVAGAATGKGHSFVVGDGLNLVFIDRAQRSTHYKVCWEKRSGAASRCWRRTTGDRGQRSLIFTAAPSQVGNFIVRWFLHGHIKGHWDFHNGVGD